jgi:AraC-like DNA-binding protein
MGDASIVPTSMGEMIGDLESTKGILNPQTIGQKFEFTRQLPSPDLRGLIERYWIIRWDLETPHEQETIPYPCVNLVMERNNSRVWGVISGKFTRRLEGYGGVFGVKFRPGAFYPFLRAPISRLTNKSMAFCDVFGVKPDALEQAVFAAQSDDEQIAVMEDFLCRRLPEPDDNIELINQIIDCVVADRRITRVDQLAAIFERTPRSLQRLFSQYVGVSPKWVIKRYRLHEAAEQLASGMGVDWPQMAQELGYFDQAHFIKDFKSIIGVTPAEYARGAAKPD